MATGASFEILKSCQNSSDGRAVCMMCVALNGYHNSECKYTWSTTSSILLQDEIYPVLYTDTEGKYTCKVQSYGQEVVGTFLVLSKSTNNGYGNYFPVGVKLVTH